MRSGVEGRRKGEMEFEEIRRYVWNGAVREALSDIYLLDKLLRNSPAACKAHRIE